MNYDKNSFLSGLAVGRQLKGWGTVSGQKRQEDPRAATLLAPVTAFPLYSAVTGTLAGTPVALGWLSVGAVVSIPALVTMTGSIPETLNVSNVSLEVDE